MDTTFLNQDLVTTSLARMLSPEEGFNSGAGEWIDIDVTRKIAETFPKIITQNPIEDGSPIVDHITNMPTRITIEGGFSDLKMTRRVGTPVLNHLFTDTNLKSKRNRAVGQFNRLLLRSLGNQPNILMTGITKYKDVYISNLQRLKDREGYSVFFTMDLQVIRKLKVFEVNPANADATSRRTIAPVTLTTTGPTVASESDLLASIGLSNGITS